MNGRGLFAGRSQFWVSGCDLLRVWGWGRAGAKGAIEIGLPSQEEDIRTANLCFLNNGLFVEVSSKGLSPMIFFFDTGDNITSLYPRFAMDNLDLVSENGELVSGEWQAHGANGKLLGLELPKFLLKIGGAAVPLRPARIMLVRLAYNACHGTKGIDVLNRPRE